MKNNFSDFDTRFERNVNSGFKFFKIAWVISFVFGLGISGAIIYAIIAATQKFLM
jgi:hypothetical protein